MRVRRNPFSSADGIDRAPPFPPRSYRVQALGGNEVVAAPPDEKSKWIPAFAGMTAKTRNRAEAPFSSSKGFFNSPPSVGGDDQWHTTGGYGIRAATGGRPYGRMRFCSSFRCQTRPGREVESD